MNTTAFRYSLFAILYFIQGVGLAYFRTFQKPYLDGFRVDPDTMGLITSLLLLPFVLKILLGVLSDRVNLFGFGNRRPYIVAGLLLSAIGFGAAAFMSPGTALVLFVVSTFLGSFGVTLFDTATDGFAVDVTPAAQQPRVQAVMVGARAFAFVLMSFLFGQIIGSSGYKPLFLIMGGAMLVPLIWAFWIVEPVERPKSDQFDWRAFRALLQARFLIFALYSMLYSLVTYGTDGLPSLFMASEFAADAAQVGSYGVTRGTGALVGAGAAFFLVLRLGRRTSAFAALGLVALVSATFALADDATTVARLGLLWGVAWGFQEAVYLSLAMQIADSRIAASMFALMMALCNLGTMIGDGVATGLTDDVPFSAVFVILAAANVVVLPVLWLVFRLAPDLDVRAAATT